MIFRIKSYTTKYHKLQARQYYRRYRNEFMAIVPIRTMKYVSDGTKIGKNGLILRQIWDSPILYPALQ